MSKKYLIVHKKKIDLLNNEYLFYSTSFEFINELQIEQNKFKSINRNNKVDYFCKANEAIYSGKAVYSKTKTKVEFLDSLNILEGKMYIKKGITEDKFKFIGNNENLIKLESKDSLSLSQSIYNFDNNDNKFFELSGVLDRYYYEKNNTNRFNQLESDASHSYDNSKNRFYNRLTILYGISNGEDGDEVVNLSFDRSSEIKNLFNSDKMLKSICNLDKFANKIFDFREKFNINTKPKKIDNEVPSCSICLEDFETCDKIKKCDNNQRESRYCEAKPNYDIFLEENIQLNSQVTLNCGHTFHAECLDNIITSDLKNELNRPNRNKDFKKSINILCPLCRSNLELITYNEMNFGLLDSKIPKSRDDKFIFDYSPIKGGVRSVYNIHLNDIFKNDFIKILKISDDMYSVEYIEFSGDNFDSRMHTIHNSKVSKIVSVINLIS